MTLLSDLKLSVNNLKNRTLVADHLKTVKAAEGHPSPCHAVDVAYNNILIPGSTFEILPWITGLMVLVHY